MGIPQLLSHLRSYAAPVVFPRTSDMEPPPVHERNFIIDGPSFAYHIYHRCLACRGDARNAIEAIPAYGEVGQAAVSWLDEIEHYGFKISHIYFDGLLPDAKKNTRLSRLQSSLDQLTAFKTLYSTGLPGPGGQATELNRAIVFSHTPAPVRLSSLPAAPFLVAAVIEALRSSEYKDVTSVRPGEADTYCAVAAKEAGGFILTNDSDLLVHDIGSEGRVIFFRDLEFSHLDSKQQILISSQYHPADIAKQLGLQSLLPLGYQVRTDGWRGFKDTISRAKTVDTSSEAFRLFAEDYLPPIAATDSDQTLLLSDTLSGLDPRISEYAQRCGLSVSQTSTAASQNEFTMYLPFLLDDPARASAWGAGSHIRRLGYSLFTVRSSVRCLTKEVQRRGPRIAEVAVVHDSKSNVVEQIVSLLHQFSTLQGKLRNLSEQSIWKAFALRLVCESLDDEGKALPLREHVESILCGRRPRLSWEYIYLSAQYQAAMYSFRMLHQFTDVLLKDVSRNASDPTLNGGLVNLKGHLDELPGLDALSLLPRNTSGNVDPRPWQDAVECIYDGLQATPPVEQVVTSGKKKRKKRKANVLDTAPAKASTKPSNNLFDLLSET